MELSEGWRAPTDPDCPDRNGRVPIAERDMTLADLEALFGDAGRDAWPAIEQVRADGGEAVLIILGRPGGEQAEEVRS